METLAAKGPEEFVSAFRVGAWFHPAGCMRAARALEASGPAGKFLYHRIAFPGDMELLSVVPGLVNLQREDLSGDQLEEFPGAQVNAGLLTAVQEEAGGDSLSHRENYQLLCVAPVVAVPRFKTVLPRKVLA